MSALPVRLRLTLAFAMIMAALLAAAGLFVYARVRSNLDRSITQSLSARTADVTAIARQSDTALRESPPRTGAAPPIAQLLSASGRIVDSSPALSHTQLLATQARSSALAHGVFAGQARLPQIGKVRLLVRRIAAQDQQLLVVVGEPLARRDATLAGLREQLLLGGPAALLLSCLAGYLLVAAALRPVERLRKRAAALSARELDQRLPPIAADDELGRLQRTLDDLLARVYEAVRRERAFVADASHELRSPITALRAELELLARDQPQGRELSDAVTSAIEETDRLERLAGGLLTLARAQDGRLAVATEPIAAQSLLARAAELAAEEAARRGVSIAVAPDIEADVLADPGLAMQALRNLLANAVRHAKAHVTLGAWSVGEHLELHVRDDGSGFPEQFLARAFERFARAGQAGGEEGAGLGLAIVRTLALAQGGTAQARNLPGGGADVWIALPLAGAALACRLRPTGRAAASLVEDGTARAS